MDPEGTKGQSRTAEVWNSLMIDVCVCVCLEKYIPCTMSGSCLPIRLGPVPGPHQDLLVLEQDRYVEKQSQSKAYLPSTKQNSCFFPSFPTPIAVSNFLRELSYPIMAAQNWNYISQTPLQPSGSLRQVERGGHVRTNVMGMSLERRRWDFNPHLLRGR